MVSGSQDRIVSIAVGFNGLYAVGYCQFPANFGVVTRLLLTEGAPLPVKLNNLPPYSKTNQYFFTGKLPVKKI